MTQCEMVLKHLTEQGSLSSVEALERYGIARLASRICDLRREGHNIQGETVTRKNRYGKPVTFTVYKMGGSHGGTNL